MVKKVTYSRNNKRHPPYNHMSTYDNDSSRKRAKVQDGSDEIVPPISPPGRQAKKSSALKKGAFAGPTTIPDDDMDVDPAPDGKGRLAVFDKVLGMGRHLPPKPKKDSILGNGELAGQRSTEYNSQSRNSYLPTPPAETQWKAHQQPHRDEEFATRNGSTSVGDSMTTRAMAAPTRTLQLFEDEQPRPPYKPKAYKADMIAAPRKDIRGNRLLKDSKEAVLWSTNQTNSPFLRLPGEIRNLIFQQVLGDNTITIGYETYRMTYKSDKVHQVTPVFKYHCTVHNKERANPFKGHMPWIKITSGFQLLNNICRQMYLETAVLPYKLNMLAFSSHNVMFNFLYMEKRLPRKHLDAITVLCLPDGYVEPNMLGYLRNLEKIYVGRDVHYEGRYENKGWRYVVRKEGEEPKLVKKT